MHLHISRRDSLIDVAPAAFPVVNVIRLKSIFLPNKLIAINKFVYADSNSSSRFKE